MGGAQSRLFAEHGAAVCVADFNMEAGEAVRNDILHGGGRAIAHELDVRDEAAWAECVRATEEEFGPVSILCNNAGANFRVSFDDQSLEMWNIIMDTGLTGAFLGIKAVVPSMRRAGGGAISEHGLVWHPSGPAEVRPDTRRRRWVWSELNRAAAG